MKVIGISCSPRKGKSTYEALQVCMMSVCEAFPEITTEILELAGLEIRGCRACDCCKTNFGCAIEDDFQKFIPKLSDRELAGIVIGTPVFLGGMTSQCKAFLDRSVLFRRGGMKFRNLVGGVVSTGGVRNGGQELTIQSIHAAMLVHDMVIVGDGLDTAHFGAAMWSEGEKGVHVDAAGLKMAKNLGRRIGEICMRMNPAIPRSS